MKVDIKDLVFRTTLRKSERKGVVINYTDFVV